MTVPIGTILPYGGLVDGNAEGELASQGWLVCDGEEYSEEEYPELENTIGTIYGTSRPGMFKVPDLRGRFVRGVDAGAGRDPDAGARSGGDERTKLGSLQEDEFKSHTHTSTRENVEGPANIRSGGAGWINQGKTSATGGKETRPKNIYVNWIIKAKNVAESSSVA